HSSQDINPKPQPKPPRNSSVREPRTLRAVHRCLVSSKRRRPLNVLGNLQITSFGSAWAGEWSRGREFNSRLLLLFCCFVLCSFFFWDSAARWHLPTSACVANRKETGLWLGLTFCPVASHDFYSIMPAVIRQSKATPTQVQEPWTIARLQPVLLH
ncbi:hypothetical protein HDK90DRAFT_556539, partial [Phyllosticta capitalensis]